MNIKTKMNSAIVREQIEKAQKALADIDEKRIERQEKAGLVPAVYWAQINGGPNWRPVDKITSPTRPKGKPGRRPKYNGLARIGHGIYTILGESLKSYARAGKIPSDKRKIRTLLSHSAIVPIIGGFKWCEPMQEFIKLQFGI